MIGAPFAAQIITTSVPPARAPAPRRSRNSIRLPSDGLRAQPRVEELCDRVGAFMDEHVYLAEAGPAGARRRGPSRVPYPEILVAEICERAKSEGLWNLFMPDERYGAGLSNAEYGVLCEVMGRSPAVAPMAFNPFRAGHRQHGDPRGDVTDEQRERWLEPLLEGEIRSCFSMTEPRCRARPDDAADPRRARGRRADDQRVQVVYLAVGADVAIVMCVTDPDAHPYAREHDPGPRRQLRGSTVRPASR